MNSKSYSNPISFNKAFLGFTPIMRFTCLPSWKSIMVGILRILYLFEICLFSSTLTLAMVTWPWYSSAISFNIGAIILQGPHQEAQKSTSTKPFLATVLKFLLFKVLILLLGGVFSVVFIFFLYPKARYIITTRAMPPKMYQIIFYRFMVSSISATVIGMRFPINCMPVSVTKMSSSRRMPPKSKYFSTSA